MAKRKKVEAAPEAIKSDRIQVNEQKLNEFLDEVRRLLLPALIYKPGYKETFVGKINKKFRQGVENGEFWNEVPKDRESGLVKLKTKSKSIATYLTEAESERVK